MKTEIHRLPLLLTLIILSLLIFVSFSAAQEHRAASEPDHSSAAIEHSEETPHQDADSSSETSPLDDSGAEEHSLTIEHGESSHNIDGGGHDIGAELPLWSIIPFVGILLSIALFPLIKARFWHHNYPKVSLFWALAFAVPFLFFYKGVAVYHILHIYLIDYIPFIILLWGLFTVSGGILLRGSLKGTPIMNTFLILIGTALASWMGTTGAAMLLIRPVIRANADRKNKMHVIIFFIFLVANIGGSLTPLGDPPLFLGFIHGVPFFWTMKILPHMLFMVASLLVIFYVLDTIIYKREGVKFREIKHVPFKLEGLHNFIFLFGILAAVLMSGSWKPGEINVLGVHMGIQNLLRDLIIITMGLLSLKFTAKKNRKDNDFTWGPIAEVAYLFAGIFMTIIPALAILKAGTQGQLAFIIEAVKDPVHYFWITGALSSFLDNAPTYLTFFNTALGSLQMPEAIVNPLLTGLALDQASVAAAVSKLNLPAGEAQMLVSNLLSDTPEKFIAILKAISAGAVFFGAMTYIGNAPNFMVRSIAEENNIKMPSFFGYMLWSVGILGILFVFVTLIFC